MQYGGMKARKVPFTAGLTMLMAFTAATTYGIDVAPIGRLEISRGGEAPITVTVKDAGNHGWMLQRSADMISWDNVIVWKLYNGSFRGTFSFSEESASVFF